MVSKINTDLKINDKRVIALLAKMDKISISITTEGEMILTKV